MGEGSAADAPDRAGRSIIEMASNDGRGGAVAPAGS